MFITNCLRTAVVEWRARARTRQDDCQGASARTDCRHSNTVASYLFSTLFMQILALRICGVTRRGGRNKREYAETLLTEREIKRIESVRYLAWYSAFAFMF